MTGRTHAIIGANAVWLSTLNTIWDEKVFFVVALSAIAGLLPDADANHAKIHGITGGTTKILAMILKHRGVLHSWIAIVAVYFTAEYFGARYFENFSLIITAAFASHLFLDSLNPTGIPLLFPIKTKFRLLPKFIAPNTDGPVDWLLFSLGALALVGFFFTQTDFSLLTRTVPWP
ncbi:MAG: metal-dependent hydrolase [Parcubacteria group bacterium]|nr:metal-dependent hydrolase [Parcubacteria group bacterium]